MSPSRPTLLALLALLSLPMGCARTLHYPSRAEGPAMGSPSKAPTAVADQGARTTAEASPPPTRGTSSKITRDDEQVVVSRSQGSPLFSAPNKDGHPEVASLAAAKVDHSGGTITIAGTRFRNDCSGFVRAVYHNFGVELFSVPGSAGVSGTQYIYRYAEEVGEVHRGPTAAPGDIVFFHDSYDRNHNGKRDDRFTHVGIIESMDKDGTLTLVHTTRGTVKRGKMNLRLPDQHRHPDSGEVINSYLRRAEGGYKSMLMSQLFAGFGRVPLKDKRS